MDRFFVHFPYLVLEDESIPIMEGILKKFDFSIFANLDGDWANERYFKATKPTIWTSQINTRSFKDASNAISDGILPRAILIYYAILTITRQDYLSPRLSVTYLQCKNSIHRRLGIYDRTLLLNQRYLPPIHNEVSNSIVTLVENWEKGGLNHKHEIFSPLRALSSLISTSSHTIISVLPLIVTLEGYLIREKKRGIANELFLRISRLLGESSIPNLDILIKALYAWRSDIIHGRPEKLENYLDLLDDLKILTTRIVEAASNWLIMNKKYKNDFFSFQTYLES